MATRKRKQDLPRTWDPSTVGMAAGSPEFVIPDIPSSTKVKAFTVRLGMKDAEQICEGLRIARIARPNLGEGEFLGELALKHLLGPSDPELDDMIRERLIRADEMSRLQLEYFEKLVTGCLASMSALCERVEAVEGRQVELILSLPQLIANEANEMTKAAKRLGDAALMFGAAYK